VVYFFSLFFTFLFIFSFFKDILRQVSAVFPAMIYVWFRCFKENISKVLDTLLFLASLFQHIVVPTRITTLQPLTCHVIYFLNAKPYLGSGTPEWGCITGALPPCPLNGGERRAQVPLHTSIISNFMIHQDQFETNLLQLFAHT